jgi:mRNA-degrading endonuclease RelE of RelBE toxin-antitoxin system
MTFEIFLSRQARKFLDRTDKVARSRIVQKLKLLKTLLLCRTRKSKIETRLTGLVSVIVESFTLLEVRKSVS